MITNDMYYTAILISFKPRMSFLGHNLPMQHHHPITINHNTYKPSAQNKPSQTTTCKQENPTKLVPFSSPTPHLHTTNHVYTLPLPHWFAPSAVASRTPVYWSHCALSVCPFARRLRHFCAVVAVRGKFLAASMACLCDGDGAM
jgi:hypothetical protein